MSCICNNETVEASKKCVICHKMFSQLLTKWEREEICPLHLVKHIYFCGKCEFVCTFCKDDGWYSTVGTGGGGYHINSITKEKRDAR